MNRTLKNMTLASCLALAQGCTALGKSNSFTVTADLPPEFTYEATATYVPAKGETCTVPGGKDTQVGYNSGREKYERDSKILLRRTLSGCPLVLQNIDFYIYGWYGKSWRDFGRDSALIVVRDKLVEVKKGTFNAAGESEFAGQCQWLFRTAGKTRVLRKLLDCKRMDETGVRRKAKPFVAYTLDQLPGKTVRLRIKLADEERPYMKDTWVKVPGGWKRCMGKGFEDQYAFCYGNYKDFSTFRMPDGRDYCTLYPGCTENKAVTP
ncbi:TPA: hypothetical protein L4R01_004820 [Pseudomonas aeruginosa]|uniref:hypothetical protein n=1 Tax=Pseudomonas aeruginosa TaxID=287 RepID=UPI000937B95C|nr:hypothetical protein [Pseudomonas aeruginosa]SST11735.1 Uncharacterised protein [Acinetobacter baumannii]EJB8520126.1 hypothetical protein [Pseudomonas aeruginosa]EKJ9723953.1 hypothetical protein [Pseudomonas aeruginosa]EKW8360403.1 hypothetical protein [Pseudomonas aeruginosa]EKY1037065.1 hypothetical protein [Pseudomonas aeruginosa]